MVQAPKDRRRGRYRDAQGIPLEQPDPKLGNTSGNGPTTATGGKALSYRQVGGVSDLGAIGAGQARPNSLGTRSQPDAANTVTPSIPAMLAPGQPIPPVVDAYFHSLYADRDLLRELATADSSVGELPALLDASLVLPRAGEVEEKQLESSPEIWPEEDLKQLEEDYQRYRQERYGDDFDDFNQWRRRRALAQHLAEHKRHAEPED